ncbi:mechanosensitive ion channel domain-containing protein [Sessilibacter sp. MAH2]
MSSREIFLTLGVLLAYWIVRKNLRKIVERIGKEKNIPTKRVRYVNATLQILFALIVAIALCVIVGYGYSDISVFLGSAFAVIGVALFAQWSILSNVTSSVIVFFFFPYRVGDFIEILDGDNSFGGEVYEITLFHVILKTPENDLYTYPNAMVFQRAVKILNKKGRPPATQEMNHDSSS